jgi:hypothetical protein
MPLEEFSRDASWLCARLRLNLARHPRSAHTAPYQSHACYLLQNNSQVGTPILRCSGSDASIPGPSRRARRSKPIHHGACTKPWRPRGARNGIAKAEFIQEQALKPDPRECTQGHHDMCQLSTSPATFEPLLCHTSWPPKVSSSALSPRSL